MDIAKDEGIVAAVIRITDEHGGIDILINNAGFGMYGAMENTTLDDARYQFEMNVFGLARLTQLALPHMRQQRAGKIVNITSMGGRIYTPPGSWRPRHQARTRGLVRLSANRARSVRHRRHHRRARHHPDRIRRGTDGADADAVRSYRLCRHGERRGQGDP
jgi:NAD(P)-dependent dehydrogenase (short-subunit alcohol dehydrogenase family)